MKYDKLVSETLERLDRKGCLHNLHDSAKSIIMDEEAKTILKDAFVEVEGYCSEAWIRELHKGFGNNTQNIA